MTNTTPATVTNRHGTIHVGDTVDVFSYTTHGIEGGEVTRLFRCSAGRRGMVMAAILRQPDGTELQVAASMLVPR